MQPFPLIVSVPSSSSSHVQSPVIPLLGVSSATSFAPIHSPASVSSIVAAVTLIGAAVNELVASKTDSIAAVSFLFKFFTFSNPPK